MSKTLMSLCCLLMLAVPTVAAAQDQDQDGRPNIVFILSDDHRWDTMGNMGHPFVETPNLDRLTAEGVTPKSRAAAENPPFSTTAANMIICVAISINFIPVKFLCSCAPRS